MPGGESQIPDQSETFLSAREGLRLEKSPKSSLIEAKRGLESSVKTSLETIDKMLVPSEKNESEKLQNKQALSLSESFQKAEETFSQDPETKDPDTVASYRELGGSLRDHLDQVSKERAVIDGRVESLTEQISEKQRLVLEQKLGMGKITHLRSTRQVQKEIGDLKSARSKQLEQHEILASQEHYITAATNKLETSADKITGEVISQTINQIAEQYSSYKEKLFGDIELKRELNEQYLQKEIVPEIESIREKHPIPDEVVQKYLETVRGLMIETRPERDDPPEKKERIDNLTGQLEGIYKNENYGFSLSQIEYKIFLDPNGLYFLSNNGVYNKAFDLFLRNEQASILEGINGVVSSAYLSEETKATIKTTVELKLHQPEADSINRFNKERQDYWRSAPTDDGSLDINAINERYFNSHLLSYETNYCWNTIMNSPEVKSLFGEIGLQETERKVQERTIAELLTTPDHTDESIPLGRRLLLFKSAEAVPYTIMNCFRESGYSGDMPFLNGRGGLRESELYKYVTSLSEETVAKFEAKGEKNVSRIIQLIKQDPDRFNHDSIDHPEWKKFREEYAKKYGVRWYDVSSEIREKNNPKIRRRIDSVLKITGADRKILDWKNQELPNPTYQEIQQSLAKMCLGMMSEGDENKQFFVMHLLEKIKVPLDKESYETLGKILLTTTNPNLQAALLEVARSRHEDDDAALVIINSYPRVKPELQKEIRETVPELLERFIEREQEANQETLVAFAQALGKEPGEFTEAYKFIRQINTIYPDPIFGGVHYDPESLDNYIDLAKNPAIIPLIKKLVPYGYQFSVRHSKILPEMVQNQDTIFAAITEVQSHFPNFKYNPPYDFEYDLQTETSEQVFVSNPYECLIHNYYKSGDRAKKLEGLFLKLSEIQKTDGEFLSNFSGPLLKILRKDDLLLTTEQKKDIDPQIDRAFRSAMVTLVKEIGTGGKTNEFLEFYTRTEVLQFLARNPANAELFFAFAQRGKLLTRPEYKETASFIFRESNLILKDLTDVDFLNSLVGDFSHKADPLIRGYIDCLKAGEINTQEKELALEFVRQFRILSPTLLGGYKEAKSRGQEKIYLTGLKDVAGKMASSEQISEADRQKPFYKDLIPHVFSENAGHWGTYESSFSCSDRSGDLAGFKIKPRYEIDLLSQTEIKVRDGATLNREVIQQAQDRIMAVANESKSKEELRASLDNILGQKMETIATAGGLAYKEAKTTEEKLFVVLADAIYGTKSIPVDEAKRYLLNYIFVTIENIDDYVAGTRDRVSSAKNQDYALLTELSAFYSNRVKEASRNLAEAVETNPAIGNILRQYAEKEAVQRQAIQEKGEIDKLQVQKLGITDSFVKQLGKILEKRNDRKYSPDQVRAIIRHYEGITGGLASKTSISPNAYTRALYGQLKTQRERTFRALKAIGRDIPDVGSIYLEDINLEQMGGARSTTSTPEVNLPEFLASTTERLVGLFSDDQSQTETELNKFESVSGDKREVINAYITKTKESANARMVGGVCVATDNPDKSPTQNMWDMPNYFQLVFQDPESFRCQGLVLLHHFEDQGQKILTASLNPSNTYLLSVNEKSFFSGIMSVLEQFAKENNFDAVAFSRNATIRTNRTGGMFETAMKERVSSVNKTLKFSSPQVFSYHPNYQLDELDVVWERK